MSNASRLPALWDGLNRFQGEMDRLFGRLGTEARRALAPVYPLLNVWEDEAAFHVEAELPGLSREQLQITVAQGNQVTLEGERRPEEGEGTGWHRRERGFGRFRRTLTLPAPIDPDKVEAKMDNGVLRLTLPKAEEARPRRITVKGE